MNTFFKISPFAIFGLLLFSLSVFADMYPADKMHIESAGYMKETCIIILDLDQSKVIAQQSCKTIQELIDQAKSKKTNISINYTGGITGDGYKVCTITEQSLEVQIAMLKNENTGLIKLNTSLMAKLAGCPSVSTTDFKNLEHQANDIIKVSDSKNVAPAKQILDLVKLRV